MRFRELLCSLFGCKSGPRVRFDYVVGLVGQKHERKKQMLNVKLTNEQKVSVTLTPVTETGQPAKLDGAPRWSVVSGESRVKPSEDGLSAVIVSSNTPGDSEILIEADADLGDGVVAISDVIKVTVEGAQAKSLGVLIGTPETKTPED